MKVMFINSFYSPDVGGGAELTLKTIVEGIAGRGHQVVCVATRASKGVTVEHVGSAKVYRVGISNIYWHFGKSLPGKLKRFIWHLRDIKNRAMAESLNEIIQAERPDVVSCHNLSGFSYAVWDVIKKNRVPIVQVLHDLYLICPNSSMYKHGCACQSQCMMCRQFRVGHLTGSDQVTSVVGVSQFVLERLESYRYFPSAKKYVVHNAEKVDFVPMPEVDINSVEKLTFGYIGSVIPSKGVEWLIKEFVRVGKRSRLLIAGNGSEDYVDHLMKLSCGADVEFLGHVNPSDFFSKIDVCVVPSQWPEVLGRVAFEACAYHVPVIASRMGGLKEIVNDGVNGVLCSPNQPDSLGDSMERFILDRNFLADCVKRARSEVGEYLDTERLAASYEKIYMDALREA